VATTNVEIDSHLLARLRMHRPDGSDRELLESVLRIQLGHDASDRCRERFACVSTEEIEREDVKAVREVRLQRAAKRHAAG
jgi:hypothetical protein